MDRARRQSSSGPFHPGNSKKIQLHKVQVCLPHLNCLQDRLPWTLNSACRAWLQRPLRALACWCRRWCVDRCRLTVMTWSSTKVSVRGEMRRKKDSQKIFFACQIAETLTCGELKVGVIFPKLAELFSKWCDCWGEDEEVCSCKGVCGETGWMIWPLLVMMLLLFAVFGLMLRVEFWAGELLPLPAMRE